MLVQETAFLGNSHPKRRLAHARHSAAGYERTARTVPFTSWVTVSLLNAASAMHVPCYQSH